MSRAWYVSPVRVIPGTRVPGRWEPSFTDYIGPSPEVMKNMRGPVGTCKEAVALAHGWRKEGRNSDLYLLLVEDGSATHVTTFDPERS